MVNCNLSLCLILSLDITLQCLLPCVIAVSRFWLSLVRLWWWAPLLVWASESSEMWRHRVTARPQCWPPPPPPIQETSGDVSGARPGSSWGIMPPDNGTPPYKLSRRNWCRREPIRPRPGAFDQWEASIWVTWPVSTNQSCRDGGGWTNPRPGRGIIEGEAVEAGSPLTRCLYL